MIVYEIAKWSEVYETAESRRHKSLTWVSMPISFTSSGYQSMLDSFGEDAAAMYGTWCVLVSFAAQCPTRGRLGNTQGTPVSLSAIARVTGFPEKNFKRLIEWASRPNVRWLIAVTCDSDTTCDTARESPSDCPGDAQAKAGLPNPTQQDQTQQNPTLPNPTQPKRKKQPSEFDFELPQSLNQQPFIDAWEEWKSHRKEIKAPLTPTSVKQQLREFEEWGVQRSVAAIRYTIKKGWQGIQEDTYNSKGSTNGNASNGKQQDLFGRVGAGQRYKPNSDEV